MECRGHYVSRGRLFFQMPSCHQRQTIYCIYYFRKQYSEPILDIGIEMSCHVIKVDTSTLLACQIIHLQYNRFVHYLYNFKISITPLQLIYFCNNRNVAIQPHINNACHGAEHTAGQLVPSLLHKPIKLHDGSQIKFLLASTTCHITEARYAPTPVPVSCLMLRFVNSVRWRASKGTNRQGSPCRTLVPPLCSHCRSNWS